MTIKQVVRPFLQFVKSVLIVFIPFYWIKGMSSKLTQLNTNNEEDFQNRNSDNYKRSDVNNKVRGGIRAFSIVFAITVGAFGIAALTVPIVGWGVGITLGIVVGIGILPKIVDIIAKQAIRAISWLKHKDDPTIINASYPAKYKAYTLTSNSTDREIENMRLEDNVSTHAIMRKLYLKKQEIKHNPEGWFGLSDEQQEHCTAINLAVKFFRNNSCYNSWSYLHYPDPNNNPTKCERKYRRTLFIFEENDGFSPEMKKFLNEVIATPTL